VKVLIAEDEPLFRKILSQLLSPEFELTVTEDGTTALARLQEESEPVLAILDWVMPGMTGIDVCRCLRAQRRTAGTYVILLTARNSAADIVAGLRAGADDYVTRARSRGVSPIGGQPQSFLTADESASAERGELAHRGSMGAIDIELSGVQGRGRSTRGTTPWRPPIQLR
jgi:CheY-like chemotaxis protein